MSKTEIQELEEAVEQIWNKGVEMGLDPYPLHFEIVPASVMYEIGSYGLPGRYSHWTFGKAYHKMKMMYDFGLSRIYEVVINTDPAYAFLLEGNSLIQNKMIIAHVLAHVDFFKNNVYFSHTNRNMLDIVGTHARRIQEHEFKYGQAAVESFLDAVLSIQEHTDPNFFIRKSPADPQKGRAKESRRRPRSPYDDLFDSDQPDSQDSTAEPDKPDTRQAEKDVVCFIMNNSPVLEPWQRDIMGMIREEMAYFIPQMQTKIMNEGWASFFHSRIMRDLNLSDADHLEFAGLHSAVVSPHRGSLNPYYVGYRIYEEIEKRWDAPSPDERERFGRKDGEGRQKLFEVRELDNDISFLRNYLTKELVEDLDLFVFALQDEDEWVVTEKRWDHVRDQLVTDMTNFGFPTIEVLDGDYKGNRELYLRHRYEGAELDVEYAKKTMEYVHRLWGRDVHLESVIDNETVITGYNGKEHWEE